MDQILFLIYGVILLMFGPPVVFLILGIVKRKKESGKVFLILAVTWLLVGGGICASLLMFS